MSRRTIHRITSDLRLRCDMTLAEESDAGHDMKRSFADNCLRALATP